MTVKPGPIERVRARLAAAFASLRRSLRSPVSCLVSRVFGLVSLVSRLTAPGSRLSAFVSRWGWGIAVLAAVPTVVYFAAAWPYAGQPWGYEYSDIPTATALVAIDGPGATGRHLSTPEAVKGIYITADSYGDRRSFGRLMGLIGRTELNAVVIDLKNHKYELAFETENPELKPYVSPVPSLGRLSDVAERIHAENAYLIARFPVFQDPAFAAKNLQIAVQRRGGGAWRDDRGLLWLDPAAVDVWKYAVAVAREAYSAGFDEVQFDYIRFPSDGQLAAMSFPVYDGSRSKNEVIGSFFSYLDHELRLKSGMTISADLFGMTMWNHGTDLNIGQKLATAAPYFDYISPMVYPSHYPAGFNGFENPALYPYEVVYENVLRGQELLSRMFKDDPNTRLAFFRPWLQDFDLGAVYDASRVRAQIRASDDGGASGWLLWNAGNVYTEPALEPADDRE